MPAPLNPIVYVCVVSGYNLPELEACMARRPGDVVLVVSDHEQFEKAADRLEKLLSESLPGVAVHRPDLQPGACSLGGDDVLECQVWVRSVLVPYLQRTELAGRPRYLNFTGGTKAMTMALFCAPGWEGMDYKAASRQQLQVVALCAGEAGDGALVTSREPLPIADVSPVAVAALHNKYITQDRSNPLFDRPESLGLAQAIWDAQESQDAELIGLFDLLEQVWSAGREVEAYQRERVSLPVADGLDVARLDVWLARLAALQCNVIYRDARQLSVPGNRIKKPQRAFVDWVSGDWLEQLCHNWLLHAGMPEAAMARNLKSGPDAARSGSQREADLLLHHRGQTRLLEVKAGLPKGHSPAELESQVSSLGGRFGQTRKALFVSPRLRRQLECSRSWDNFALRCQASQVVLCHDRSSLLKFAGLSAEVR